MKKLFNGVQNMEGRNGNTVPNQFEIFADDGKYFQSYSSIIVFKPFNGQVVLDCNKWDYSRTTAKYRNQFLGETTKETEGKIKSGAYILADLN